MMTKPMWFEPDEDIYETNLYYDLFNGDYSDRRIILSLLNDHKDYDFFSDMAKIEDD